MSDRTPDQVDLGRRLLDFLKNHGDLHRQDMWLWRPKSSWSSDGPKSPVTLGRALNECGTTACAAGWAVLLAGGRICRTRPPECGWEAITGDGRASGAISGVAAALLGLSTQEATDVFFARSELEAIYELDQIFNSGGDR